MHHSYCCLFLTLLVLLYVYEMCQGNRAMAIPFYAPFPRASSRLYPEFGSEHVLNKGRRGLASHERQTADEIINLVKQKNIQSQQAYRLNKPLGV